MPKMKALILDQTDESDWKALIESNVDIPTPKDDEVLIKVKAIGVNRADIFARMGKYPINKKSAFIPGLEASGEIILTGSKASEFRPGQQVYGITNSGSYAEYCLVSKYHCHGKPQHFTHSQSAALAEVLSTAYYNLFIKSGLKTGEKVLIHGGASGIGIAATQLAAFYGAKVFTTCGTNNKQQLSTSLGAAHSFNYNEPSLWPKIREKCQNFDVILDMHAGTYTQEHIQLLNKNGRLCIISFIGGSKIKELNLSRVLTHNLSIIGTMTKNMTNTEKQECKLAVDKFLTECNYQNFIHSEHKLKDYNLAHLTMLKYKHSGKMILQGF